MRDLTEREIFDNLRIDKLNRRLKKLCNLMEDDHKRLETVENRTVESAQELSKSKIAQNKILISGIGCLILSISANIISLFL